MPRYDDDDDYDRPRRRNDDDFDDRPRRKRSGDGPPVGLIVGGGVGLVVLVVGGIVLALTMRKGAPEDAKADPVPPGVPDARPNQVPRPAPNPGAVPPAPKRPTVGTPMPTGIPPVRQMVFAGGEDGVVGLIGYNLTAGGEVLTVAKTRTGEKVGSVQIDQKDTSNGYAVAPGGRFAAVKGSEPFNGDPVVLFEVTTGQSFRFTPYKRSPATISDPNLVAVAFAGPDKLVTLNERSGFDVWEVPGMKRLAGQPARPREQFMPLGTAGVGWAPKNYGLSADGRTLAVFNGTGFSFFETATATPTAKTEAVCEVNQSMNFWAAAFSADGARFACLMSQYQGKQATGLLVWEAATGKRVVGATLPQNETATGFGWWGPNHLACWQGGMNGAKVLDVQTGRFVAEVKTDPGRGGQLIAAWTPGDKLWYSFDGPGFTLDGASPVVQSIAAPPRLPGRTLTLTPDGPRWEQ